MKNTNAKMSVRTKSNPVWFKLFATALMILIIAPWANAQSGQVSGKILDRNGEPVAGAFVRVVGTQTGTMTETDGSYSLKASTGQELEVSFMGFKTQTVSVGTSPVNVVLEQDNTTLEESVVVGYGVQKRRDIVGAMEVVKTEEIQERTGSAMNMTRALQGNVPGLTLTFTDGKPSRGATVRIRGNVTSIGSGGSALVLIDGVEGDMNSVNPEDIESITVLKDASSTAVYGARGTFGVILLTTKTPEKGQAKVTYNGTVNFAQRTVKPEFVWDGLKWTNDFIEAYNNCRLVDPTGINNSFPYNREWHQELERRSNDPTLDAVRINTQGNYEYFGNTNWYDLFYKDWTVSHQHNINVSGGTDAASYYVSGRIFDQGGIYKVGDDKYRTYNLSAKGNVNIRPWFRVENKTELTYYKSHQPTNHTGVSINNYNPYRMFAHQAYPMTVPYNPDGSWTNAAVYTGYAGFVEGDSWRKDQKFTVTNKTTVTIDIIKDILTAKASYAFYHRQSGIRRSIAQHTYSTAPGITSQRPTDSMYTQTENTQQRNTADATLTYTPNLGPNNHLSLMAGWNIEDLRYKSNYYSRQGMIDSSKPNFTLVDGENFEMKDNGSYNSGLVGVFYRLSYNYKGRYLVELSGRGDGNSRFPAGQKWGYFPSGSIGWRISEEPFLKNANWLDNLKIRLSAGTSGNGLISNAYAYMSTMSLSKSSVVDNGNIFKYTSAPSPIPDGLTWEKASTYDIGLDFEALNGRLNLTADVYRKMTTDMYVAGDELPAVFGNSAPKGNYADMKTNGWELSVGWRDSYNVGGRNLSYNIKAAVWDSRSFITKYTSKTGTLPTNYSTKYYEGMEIGELWGYTCNGLYQTADQLAEAPDYSKFKSEKWSPNLGDPIYEDLNGDGKINNGDNTISNHGDLKVIGNTSPRYLYSINLGINWNGIGLSAMLQGVGRRDWYPAKESNLFWGKYGRPYSVDLPQHAYERWSEDNPDAYWPRLVGYNASNTNGILSQPNTRYLQSAAYLRLKNLSIDYTFPKKIVEAMRLQALKVYVTGENLLTWTPLKKHAVNFDPENIYAGDTDFLSTAGGDGSGDGEGYPVMRTFTIGLSITF
ncbi:MAG: SusC/RagA family TonB-linked outer membrane protein [Candidatus Cryptobacteroides sp.]